MSPAPAGLVDGPNRFTASRNNPITLQIQWIGLCLHNTKYDQASRRNHRIVQETGRECAKDKDTGERPGFPKRVAVESQWDKVVVSSDIAFRIMGKDYEMSRMMFYHYLVGDGAPLVYIPPQPVQDVIVKHFSKAGHYSNVNPFNWGNADLRNGLGHFNLDVVDAGDGKKLYFISDRYQFPEKDDKGKPVRHGFRSVRCRRNKPTALTQNCQHLESSKARESGSKERLEVVKTEKSVGAYALCLPTATPNHSTRDFIRADVPDTPILYGLDERYWRLPVWCGPI